MASIKLHAYIGKVDGTKSCDFRGDKFVGAPDDQHRTIAEVDPADDTLVAKVLEFGPEVNKLLARLSGDITQFAGSGAGLRLGVWDK